MRAECARLDLLETGDDETASVRFTLSWPLGLLDPADGELLRRLVDGDPVDVWRSLSRLVAVDLVAQHGPRRYHLHDLRRAVVREIALTRLPAVAGHDPLADHAMTTS